MGPCLHVERPVDVVDLNARHTYSHTVYLTEREDTYHGILYKLR